MEFICVSVDSQPKSHAREAAVYQATLPSSAERRPFRHTAPMHACLSFPTLYKGAPADSKWGVIRFQLFPNTWASSSSS
jgi:hypothetical protein